jgi:proline iminopeptidase
MKAPITSLTIFCFCLLIGCNSCTNKPGTKTGLSESKTTILLNDGTKLTYFIEGEGYPCIVVTEGELLTNAISKELKNHFKFIFVNARMNVLDPGDVNKITFEVLADDVEQIRKALDLNKICVFGHSVSGLIALEYARKYPQFTTHVIMNGTPPYSDELLAPTCKSYWETTASKERKEMWTKNWKGISRDSLDRLGTSEAGKLLYILDGPQCFYDYNFSAASFLTNVYWNMSVWNQIFKKLLINYQLSEGKSIETPVFMALGKYDYFVPYMVWDDQKTTIPNLFIYLFEKSGHYSFFEEEDLFRKELTAWFEKTKEKNNE